MRQMAVEEEMLLVDPSTGSPQGVATAVLEAAKSGEESSPLEAEIQREQVEMGTEPCATSGELDDELRRWRRVAVGAGRGVGVEVAALATSPLHVDPHLSPTARYERMLQQYGRIASNQLSCGCHVHVDVDSLEEGVGVLDRIGPWLPVLRALTANSPFWHGEDTGYASYRTTVWDRWPSAGPTGPFGSWGAYEQTTTAMLATGALLDEGMIYFDARLSRSLSTVELRVADVCLEVEDAVLFAALARGLVSTAARQWHDGEPASSTRQEVLALAHWRAARSGLREQLVNPCSGRPAPADAVLNTLCEHVGPALTEAGDEELVRQGCARLRERGTGSDIQLGVAREHHGDLRAVVADAVSRTSPRP